VLANLGAKSWVEAAQGSKMFDAGFGTFPETELG
jgi:hypothetical protein